MKIFYYALLMVIGIGIGYHECGNASSNSKAEIEMTTGPVQVQVLGQ